MSDHNSFEERLKRLEAKNGGFKKPPSFDFDADTSQDKPVRAGSEFGLKHAVIAVVAIVAVILVGSGAFVAKAMFDAGSLHAQPSQKHPEQMRDSVNDTFTRLAKGQTPNSVNGLFLEAAFRKQAGNGPKPIAFLPKSQGKWMRVTKIDAQKQDAMAAAEAEWTTATRTSAAVLKGHPNWRTYEFFMTANREPSLEGRATAHIRETAIFMHPSGQYLRVTLRFLNKRTILGEARLGPVAEKASWIDQLQKLEEKERSSGSVFERVKLAGIPSINRMKTNNRVSIRSSGNSVNIVDVSVPLSSHAVLYMSGVASVREMEKLIRTIDQKTLIAAHDSAPKS